MSSRAHKAFQKNAQEVERLWEIHQILGGSARGRRHRMEVLNKSAIVLITAFWEAYCEDIAEEALEHIVNHARDASTLPKELKKRIAKEVKENKNEIAVWDLADGGWRLKVKARLKDFADARSRNLNTPKAEHIEDLFEKAVGLCSVSRSWRWKRKTVERIRDKLNDYVTLRGSIAHRGSARVSCTKAQVEEYFDLVKALVARTGGAVNRFAHKVTGKLMWVASRKKR